ncbi:hypothetical protein [Pseudobacteriovorax antillogorgiicola]|uniref:Uncharacterized protein n=1 Tax=Pseudobacteriovorax antillogorgiicola TaxID=1513793 RepID=A0A1Y6BD13_9BACT|nr:hypothetical protein [Pseudobacteriovorax antillogorgiicola]TCS57303.1 hypothetical protein EDD56_10343 [Pseudobacteriovorax antillogorgiicola]SMF02902.1 hypothetical protein SAMN06296036_103290 [Pseudobacteriovorax antillogorgiicola]
MTRTLKRNLIIIAFLALLSPNFYYIFLESFPGGLLQKIQFTLLSMMVLFAPLLLLPLRSYIWVLLPLGLLLPFAHLHLYFIGDALQPTSVYRFLSSSSQDIEAFASQNMAPIVVGGCFAIVFWTCCFCILHAPIDLKFTRRFKIVFFSSLLFLQVSLWAQYQSSPDRSLARVDLVETISHQASLRSPGLFPTDAVVAVSKAGIHKLSPKRSSRAGH